MFLKQEKPAMDDFAKISPNILSIFILPKKKNFIFRGAGGGVRYKCKFVF